MTRPSMTKSDFVKPKAAAFTNTSSIIFFLFSAVSGISPPASGSSMNMAPYFAATGNSFSILVLSPEIELISARPGYNRSAASITSIFEESITRGRSEATERFPIAPSIVSFSSIPGIPTLTSRSDAPFFSCSFDMVRTRDIFPSRSSCWRAFFPVGLIRSPTIERVRFPSSITDDLAELTALIESLTGWTGCNPATAPFNLRIYSGVVPQHPPMRFTPFETNSAPNEANVSAFISNMVSPSISSGIPAFGFATNGIVAQRFIASINFTISSGPVEQLQPTASAPRLCRVTRAVTGSVPLSVLPFSSYVIVTMVNLSVISFMAIRAALVSWISIMVSTTKRSTPPSRSPFTCSL